MQVYADQGSLIGCQQEAAGLASRLAAAESRQDALKAALADEQASRQNEAKLAATRNAAAVAEKQMAADKVRIAATRLSLH